MYVGIVVLLVSLHIHLFDEQAVSRYAVTLVEQNDIANDEAASVDGLGGSVLPSEHSNFLVHNFRT